VKFFPMSKTNALRGRYQTSSRLHSNPFLRLGKGSRSTSGPAPPPHGMEYWLVLQNFYEGLTPMSKGHVDAAAGGVFLSLTIENAMALIEKMVAN